MSASAKGNGFSMLAEFIESDEELSLYRRFQRLSARNLLYIQSELLDLEIRLAEFDEEDQKETDMNELLTARCWEALVAKAEENPRQAERMEMIRKIRRLMKEYQEALLLQKETLALKQPNDRAFKVFLDWFTKNRPFVGHGRNLIQRQEELVSLKTGGEQDRMSRLMRDYGGRFLPGSRRSESSDVKYYSEQLVRRIISTVSVVLAALLLEGAIVALYLVRDERIRLGLIAVFTCLFAGSVGFLTHARRAEMFAATAAYAAVLVVFVSGDLGGAG